MKRLLPMADGCCASCPECARRNLLLWMWERLRIISGRTRTGTNMFGVGGRLGFGVFPQVKLEGEVAYDFEQEFASGFPSTSGER